MNRSVFCAQNTPNGRTKHQDSNTHTHIKPGYDSGILSVLQIVLPEDDRVEQ